MEVKQKLGRVDITDTYYNHLRVHFMQTVENEGVELGSKKINIELKCGDFDGALSISQQFHDVCQVLWPDALVEEYTNIT